MNYIQGCFLIICMVVAATACRSTKSIQTAIARKDTAVVVLVPVVDNRADSLRFIHRVLDTVKKNRIDFKTFSARIKVDFEGGDGKKNPPVNAYVRLFKDSILWISINATVVNFEAFRVLITPDSVKVMDKLKNVVQLRSVEYLQEVAKLPLTFNDLQDLLVGNPVFLDSNVSSYRAEERSISLISIGTLFKHFLTVNKEDFTLQHSKLDDVDASRARTADLTYGDYQLKNGFKFSTYRRITVSEKKKLDIEMQFKQFDFNADLNFPFNIPRNFKRK
jgi:hypothetical protein